MTVTGFKGFIGNRHLVEFLRTSLASGRTAHAYLFTGPASVGKTTAARSLASQLLATEKPEQHPDFHLVERTADPKTGKLHSSIVSEQIEELVGRASRTAFLSGHKVFVIDGADRLNPAAANALLKTLEEPKGDTCLILVAPSAGSVLPTLRSRCQLLEFRAVSAEEIASALKQDGLPAEQALLFARLSGGRPGQALLLARDPAAFRKLRETREAVLRFLEGGAPERFEAVSKLLPPKLPFAEAADRGRLIFDLAAELLRDAFAAANGLESALIHIDLAERLRKLGRETPGLTAVRAALEGYPASRRLIDENVGARTALESFALTF